MRVRVWWIGVAAMGLVALAVLWLSGRRAGSTTERGLEADGRRYPEDGGGSRSDPFNRPQASGASVSWPRPGTRPPGPPEVAPSTMDASALAAELEQQVEAIRASGPGSGQQLHDAEAVSRPWEAMARASGKEIDLKSWECHRLGCFATAVHHSRESVDELTSKVLGSAELASWPGTKTQSAPIPGPNGTFEVTWLLYLSPDAGVP
jgi:hypothetical protein